MEGFEGSRAHSLRSKRIFEFELNFKIINTPVFILIIFENFQSKYFKVNKMIQSLTSKSVF